MRLVYITAGAAGMYCGSCIHDNTLAAALISKGHEVTLVPTYTPSRTDEANVSVNSVFYGAINVYLQEKSSIFRHTPRAFDWLLNRPGLVNWVTRFSSSTSPEDLGALTVSILEGEDGHLRKELEKLVEWLSSHVRPDIVHLTNSMFLGMAREIRERLNVPVLCSLQGEDVFLEDLAEPYKGQAKQLIREKVAHINGFVATSKAYADFMTDYLRIPRKSIHVVPLGINLKGHGSASSEREKGITRIGYLARICPEKGLHLLVDAFELLVQRRGKESLRLETAGYLGARDQSYFDEIRARIVQSGWQDCFRHRGEVDRQEKIEFLSSLDILSVPTVYRDPKGLFVLEALANEVAVVQPAHGNFPELIAKTGGGRLVEPNSAEALAEGLEFLIENVDERSRIAKAGKEAVRKYFNTDMLAENALAVYRKYVP